MLNLNVSHVCTSCDVNCDNDEFYCPNCGSILPNALRYYSHIAPAESPSTPERTPKDARWGTGYFHPHAKLFLTIMVTNQTLPVTIGNTPIVVGRRGGSAIPHADLTPFGALELGVSRYHLRIERVRSTLQITDLDSDNGTLLNQEWLIPCAPYQLRNRSSLQLGKMMLSVRFD
ncbi:MAG: FHA domain-containing protein [Chloroflexota bacterium]